MYRFFLLVAVGCGGGASPGVDAGPDVPDAATDAPSSSTIDLRLLAPVALSGAEDATHLVLEDAISLSGLAAGDGLVLTVNGAPVPVNGNSWTLSASLPSYPCNGMAPAQELFIIRAVNVNGDSVEQRLTVVRDPCLPLDTWVSGEMASVDRYANASCPGPGGEAVYRLDVPEPNGADLVIYTEEFGFMDTQVNVSTDRTPAGNVLSCKNGAGGGQGEVAELPGVEKRRYFVVVEAASSFVATFRVRAFLRP